MEFNQILPLEIGTCMENGEARMRLVFEGLTCNILRCYISQFLDRYATTSSFNVICTVYKLNTFLCILNSYGKIKSFTYDRDYNIRVILTENDQEVRFRVFKYYEYITPNSSVVVLDRVHADINASNHDFWDLYIDLRVFVLTKMQECVDLTV